MQTENEQTLNEQKSPEAPKKPKKKWKMTVFWLVFFIACAGALIFTMLKDFVFNKNYEVSDSLATVLKHNWYYLFIAAGCCAMFFFCQSLVYSAMMHQFTGKPRLGLCIATTMLGNFYDSVTTFSTGGQPFQMNYLRKHNVPDGATIALPIVEYTLERFVFVIYAVIAVILCATAAFGQSILPQLYESDKAVYIMVYTAAGIGLVLNFAFPLLVIVALFSRKACGKMTGFAVKTAKFFRLTKNPDKLYEKIMSKLEANIECMKMFSKRKRLYLCVLFQGIAKLSIASIGYFVLKAFAYPFPNAFGWLEVVSLYFIMSCAISFIPTPGSSGAADLSFYGIFFNPAVLMVTAAGVGSLATLSWRLIIFYLPILVGAVYVLSASAASRRRKRRALRESVSETPTENKPV